MFLLQLDFLLKEAAILVDKLESCVVRRGMLQRPHEDHCRMLRNRTHDLKEKIVRIMDRDTAVSEAYLLRVGHRLEENEFYLPEDFERGVQILQQMKNGGHHEKLDIKNRV